MKVERAKNPKVAFALVGIILLSLFAFQIGRASQIATTNYVLETPLPIADVYVGQYSNTSYFAVNGSNWDNFVVSSNASYVINSAFDCLTVGREWQETVLLTGLFTIDSPIQIPNYTHFILQGGITLDNGISCNILENADGAACEVTIEGGYLYGVDGGAGSYAGIAWNQTSDAPYYHRTVNIKNVYIEMGSGGSTVGIYFRSGSWSYNIIPHFSNVKAVGYSYGIYLYGITDGDFAQIYCGVHDTASYAFYLYGGGWSIIDGLNTDGPVYFYASRGITLANLRVDVMNRNMHGLSLIGTQSCTVSNGAIFFANPSGGYNTKSAVRLEKRGTSYPLEYSLYNSVSNIYCGRAVLTDTGQYWLYGVDEAESSVYVDYNLFSNINANDTLSGNNVQGTHSNITNSLP